MSGSGISWAICNSAPCSRQITTPAPHRSVFYRSDALPAAQPTASMHWREHSKNHWRKNKEKHFCIYDQLHHSCHKMFSQNVFVGNCFFKYFCRVSLPRLKECLHLVLYPSVTLGVVWNVARPIKIKSAISAILTTAQLLVSKWCIVYLYRNRSLTEYNQQLFVLIAVISRLVCLEF